MSNFFSDIASILWKEFPNAILVVENSKIIEFNEISERLFQLKSAKDLRNITFDKIIGNDSNASGQYWNIWKATQEKSKQKTANFECILKRFTGELFWASIKVNHINNEKYLLEIEDKSQHLRLKANEDVAEIRAEQHNKAMKQMAKLQAKNDIIYDDFFLENIKIVKETLNVKRVSVWLFNKRQTRLKCISQYGKPKIDSTFQLEKLEYPIFFETIKANNIVSVNTDNPYAPLGKYFKEILHPQGIHSVMYLPIADIEKVVGFLAIEQKNLRTWHIDEQSFAVSMAEVIAQALVSFDRRKIRAELFTKDRFYRTLIENSTDVFAIVDKNAVCTYISPSIERIFGYHPEEITGNNGEERIHPDDRKRVLKRLIEIANSNTKAIDIIVFRYRHKKGKYHYVECVCQNQMQNPIVKGLVVNFRNIDDRIRAEKQQKANVRAQYQLLKTQVNPHFLFNCLNTLASLIYIDEEKAEDFVLTLASVYRYLLENRQDETAKLSEELSLVKDYLFLQKFRFNENLKVEIDLEESLKKRKLIALSLQLVIENAVKHNEISKLNPLHIKIYEHNNFIVVENNIQLRKENVQSTGIGIPNIQQRYALISKKEAQFFEENGFFYAKLPLL